MSQHNADREELHTLIGRLIDDHISDSDVARLDEILRDDPSAANLLMEYCQLHSVLTFELHAEEVVNQFAEARKIAKAREQRLLNGQVSRRLIYVAGGVLAASLLLAMLIPGRLGPKPVSFAVDNDSSQPGINVFRIESGTTQLKLAKVGSVSLQGPAELEMLTPTRAKLNYGRIRVRVSDPRGYGFVVEMPNGEVTDLGTEFGVDVSNGGNNGLVVFDGAVDLRIPAKNQADSPDYIERLERGDGVMVHTGGKLERIMAIYTGSFPTFGQLSDSVSKSDESLIVDVSDNLRRGETRKFYEIVPRGLQEGVLAYADRSQYQWKAATTEGIPSYLIGADYVKPFNNDKMRKDFHLSVTVSRPTRLFVFFDDRIPAPSWLTTSFQDTGDDICIHLAAPKAAAGSHSDSPSRNEASTAEPDSRYSIWARDVTESGVVELGANAGASSWTAMYGIAAVALDPDERPQGNPVDSSLEQPSETDRAAQ